MTQKEAYIEGFCKAAEAHGVDPEQLVKVALSQGMVQAGKGIVNGFMGWLGGIRAARNAKSLGLTAKEIARARRYGTAAGRSIFGRMAEARRAAQRFHNYGGEVTPDLVSDIASGVSDLRYWGSAPYRDIMFRTGRLNHAAVILDTTVPKTLYKGLFGVKPPSPPLVDGFKPSYKLLNPEARIPKYMGSYSGPSTYVRKLRGT